MHGRVCDSSKRNGGTQTHRTQQRTAPDRRKSMIGNDSRLDGGQTVNADLLDTAALGTVCPPLTLPDGAILAFIPSCWPSEQSRFGRPGRSVPNRRRTPCIRRPDRYQAQPGSAPAFTALMPEYISVMIPANVESCWTSSNEANITPATMPKYLPVSPINMCSAIRLIASPPS